MPLLANIIAFYLGWFACVLGGANHLPWLGTAVALLLIAVHLWWTAQPVRELRLILLSGVLGLVLDSVPVALGWVHYPSGNVIAGLAPYWIVALWMLFATTLNSSLRWLQGRWALAALAGAMAGPLAYYGGAKLGGITLLAPLPALLLLALIWSAALPLLLSWATAGGGTAETDRQNGGRAGSARAGKPA